MKLPQDLTQNVQASPLLTAAAQGREGLANQSKQGFADSLRHQISLVAGTSRLSAKAGKQESGRQPATEQQGHSKRGTELPVREQKLPRNNQEKSGAAESHEPNSAKRSKQSSDDSDFKRSQQSTAADNAPNDMQEHDPYDVALLYPSVDSTTLAEAIGPEAAVALDQFVKEMPAPNISDTDAADDILLPELLNATDPSSVDSYGPHLPDRDMFAAHTNAAQKTDTVAALQANGITTMAQPRIIPAGLVTANTEFKFVSDLSGSANQVQPEQAANVMASALHKGATVIAGLSNPATGARDLQIGGMEEMLLHTPSQLLVPAAAPALAGHVLPQNGNRQQTGTASAGLTQSALSQASLSQIQTGATDGHEMSDVSFTSDYVSDEAPDAQTVFSERLQNQKPALPSSAQYASILAQSAPSSPFYADAPIANGLLSMLVSGQQGSAVSLESASLTATQPGAPGNPASHNSSSGLAASLYTLDQRQQAAAEARQAHAHNARGIDTSMAATSALKLPGLDVAFGQAGWADRLGRMMLLQSAQGSSSAQIRLDPPELGSLTVRIQLADQAAAVNFVSPHAMVRDALEQQSARLQEMFREQGLDLVDVSVSDQSTQSGDGEHRGSDGAGSGSSMLAVEDKESSGIAVKTSESLIDFYA